MDRIVERWIPARPESIPSSEGRRRRGKRGGAWRENPRGVRRRGRSERE